MTRSALRSAWLVGSVFLFACGGRTLGLETDDEDLGNAGTGGSVASKGGTGGTSGSTSGTGGTGGSGGSGGSISTGGGGGTGGSGGSGGSGGTGVGAMGGTGGSGGSTTGKGGSNTGKGGSGGTGGSTGKGGKGGNTGKGGKGGSNGGFKSCDQCQEAVYQQCEPLYDQCLGEKECGGLIQCFQDCGNDDNCAGDCFEQFPGAEGTYYQLAGCFLCGQCESVCDTPPDFCDQFSGSAGSAPTPSPGMPPQPGQ